MSFFDEEVFFGEEGAPAQVKADREDTGFTMPSGVSAAFYDREPSGTARKKRKEKKAKIIISTALITSVVLIGTAMLTVLIRGRGWAANLILGGKNIEFTLPVASYPQNSIADRDENGRYTTEGLVKAVSDTVVEIQIFKSGNGYAPTSQGSGIIISDNGYIVTNAHVVSEATLGIRVVLQDGGVYDAVVIGSDSRTDIAVIKIVAEELNFASFADSDGVSLGEDVCAIGAPAGFANSVTKGIVSGLNREIAAQSGDIKMECLQLDAAINPGSSGGAIFNMYGQVIAISSSKLASTSYDGIGFAITTNAAKPIIESLIENGFVKGRIRIGITFYGISDAAAQSAKVEMKPGLYIASIDEDCDVAKTELKTDDVITEVEGVKVTSLTELKAVLEGKQPGDTITAKVYRPAVAGKGTEFEISFKLMEDNGGLEENKDSKKA
ncbi:MAG: trypsin-like peptidase domain-containing protein [Ruminococcus sp.]|nr:trypsin-like peptidase domain-containing protein [Ruminococcus sp.]